MSQRFAYLVIGGLLSIIAGAGLPLAAAQNGGSGNQKPTFEGDTALWTMAIKPDKTADFERVMSKMRRRC